MFRALNKKTINEITSVTNNITGETIDDTLLDNFFSNLLLKNNDYNITYF